VTVSLSLPLLSHSLALALPKNLSLSLPSLSHSFEPSLNQTLQLYPLAIPQTVSLSLPSLSHSLAEAPIKKSTSGTLTEVYEVCSHDQDLGRYVTSRKSRP
jgi:hypothetical protein